MKGEVKSMRIEILNHREIQFSLQIISQKCLHEIGGVNLTAVCFSLLSRR